METVQAEVRPYSIRFKLLSVPPSVNSLYNVIFSLKKVEMKPEVRLWKTQAKMLIPVWKPQTLGKSGFLYFKMDVYTRLYTKDGLSVKKFDVMNMEKVLIDAVCEKIGIDDKFIVDCHTKKVHVEDGLEEHVQVEVGFID